MENRVSGEEKQGLADFGGKREANHLHWSPSAPLRRATLGRIRQVT